MNYVIGGRIPSVDRIGEKIDLRYAFLGDYQGCISSPAADPSTLRTRTWSKDARTSEHAIDEHFPLRNAQ